MRGTTHLQKVEDIRVEITLDMTIKELNEITLALEKGKEGYYGPTIKLIGILTDTYKRVNYGFHVYDQDGKAVE